MQYLYIQGNDCYYYVCSSILPCERETGIIAVLPLLQKAWCYVMFWLTLLIILHVCCGHDYSRSYIGRYRFFFWNFGMRSTSIYLLGGTFVEIWTPLLICVMCRRLYVMHCCSAWKINAGYSGLDAMMAVDVLRLCEFLAILIHSVTESVVTMQSPSCGYCTIWCVELNGEDLSCYSNSLKLDQLV